MELATHRGDWSGYRLHTARRSSGAKMIVLDYWCAYAGAPSSLRLKVDARLAQSWLSDRRYHELADEMLRGSLAQHVTVSRRGVVVR